MIRIVAGNEMEARQWAATRQLANFDWVYIRDPMDLGTLPFECHYVEFTGSCEGRDDLDILRDTVRTYGQDPVPRHGIRAGYRHRDRAEQSIREVCVRDECQDGVYRLARREFAARGARRVLDLGCGGGSKLLKHFGDLPAGTVLGLDTPDTVAWLAAEYPRRQWLPADLRHGAAYAGVWDFLVCSDVIEHLENPDAALDFIEAVAPDTFVLSTPDRGRLQAMFGDGPPRNTAHYREWSFEEFGAYVGARFDVLGHYHPGASECTQLIVGTTSK